MADDFGAPVPLKSADGFGVPVPIAKPDLPDTNKQAHDTISNIINKKPERAMQQTMGGMPMFVDVPAGQKESFEKSGREGYAEGGKTGMEMVGSAVGGEALPPAKGALGILMRMMGAGGGATLGNVAGQVASTGKAADPREALKTGGQYALAEGAGEVLTAGAKPVSKFMKDVLKSKTAKMAEEHAAQLAEAEKAYKVKLAEHQERVAKVKKDYAEKLSQHTEDVKTASTRQAAAAAKSGAALEHQNQLAGLLKENLELANEKISRELGKEFEAINDAVQAKNPKVNVNDVERTARAELYFPDSVSAFNKIMENVAGKLKMTDYSLLRKTYSNLNDVLYGGGEMPDDLYKAVKTVRDSLGKDLQSAANQVGLGGKYKKALTDWSEYKDIWADKTSIAKGGSPIRRIMDAQDPAFVVDQLKGKAGQRLLDDIGKYGKYGADKALAGRLKGFIEEVKAMPSSAGEIPAAPKRPEFPKAPDQPVSQPFDAKGAQRQNLIDMIRKGAGVGGGVVGAELLYRWLMGSGEGPHNPIP